ncbi:hypothetical protein ONS95_004301 [Cadophora gregata]|uniref:uncharacterized protein n=1 Tax=Cadophora gregata TaxID=51156 RepID=UPI0026DABEC8|nr:uncharacterized protein ONS95_004301 [Cadophora gregata]KAK0105316.1 hypothetical protein ONS96_004712 [Cadophora gregata f. sp. sojae]KAK0105783.1 hypothetical protein ONS95_004301 [Cadophora gregata]
MESTTDIVKHVLPALSRSNSTSPTTTSKATTPKGSPNVKLVDIPTIKPNFELEPPKETEVNTGFKSTTQAPATNSLHIRPKLPHANTDTQFEVVKEVQRVERRWRGMYDRNRAANPGAIRVLEK